jgi:hypothetical protein
MDQDIFKHDHAISSWITLCISRYGVTTTVLMVETDLNLNAKDSNYRKDSIDSLVAAAVAYVRKLLKAKCVFGNAKDRASECEAMSNKGAGRGQEKAPLGLICP